MAKSVLKGAIGIPFRLLFVGVIMILLPSTVGCPKGSSTVSRQHTPESITLVGGTKDPHRRADIIFIHGLGGDARGTWQGSNPAFFWPEQIGKSIADIGVWSINYDAYPSEWLGGTMPIIDRSKALLELIRVNEIGTRPIVFIGHSLGGIVIKQMLRDAYGLNNGDWEAIGDETQGVIFLATPHTGSDAALMLNLVNAYMPTAVRSTVTVQELESNAAALRDLNWWYRSNIPKEYDIDTSVLYENLPVPALHRVIVDPASSDPGIDGVIPIRVDADHVSICKLDSEKDFVYQSVMDFINRTLALKRPTMDLTFTDFVKLFNDVRRDAARLEEFKKAHVRQKVIWTGFVKNIVSDDKRPAYSIGASADARAQDQVLARFSPACFRVATKKGAKIDIEGILDKSTNEMGAVLHRCKVLRWIENGSNE
jgi:hypothetical protein